MDENQMKELAPRIARLREWSDAVGESFDANDVNQEKATDIRLVLDALADARRERDEFAALMVVPHPDGSQTGATPKDLRAMIDELQGEWDNAEKRLAEAKTERDMTRESWSDWMTQAVDMLYERSTKRDPANRLKLEDFVGVKMVRQFKAERDAAIAERDGLRAAVEKIRYRFGAIQRPATFSRKNENPCALVPAPDILEVAVEIAAVAAFDAGLSPSPAPLPPPA